MRELAIVFVVCLLIELAIWTTVAAILSAVFGLGLGFFGSLGLGVVAWIVSIALKNR